MRDRRTFCGAAGVSRRTGPRRMGDRLAALVRWLIQLVLQHHPDPRRRHARSRAARGTDQRAARSEEHTSELQSLMRISYADFCLKKNKLDHTRSYTHEQE